ncbi:hypothetical protein AHAS_Ahas03G0054000 [Arachis hypogaea]
MYICAHINRNNLRCSLPRLANLTVVAPYSFASFFRRTLADKYLILPILYSIQFANTKELQMAKKPGPKPGSKPSKLSVYLYIPNIIGSLLNPFLSFGESYRDIDGRFSNKSAKDINSLFSNCNKFSWMHNQAAYKCDSGSHVVHLCKILS